ncbi:MAG: YkvA family protein [Pseudomonadota bacterium]
MSIRIAFDLTDKDLDHFRMIMQQASKNAESLSEQQIIEAAETVMVEVGEATVPDFITERLSKLKVMTGMLRDSEWQLPEEETSRVLSALAYFSEPEDLIPDHIPGLGFLDDAIMVELVVRELKHEIEAYEDFCAFRDREEQKRDEAEDDVTREEWLAGRRMELHSRMRRRRRGGRRRRRSGGGSSGGKSPFSLF